MKVYNYLLIAISIFLLIFLLIPASCNFLEEDLIIFTKSNVKFSTKEPHRILWIENKNNFPIIIQSINEVQNRTLWVYEIKPRKSKKIEYELEMEFIIFDDKQKEISRVSGDEIFKIKKE